MKRGCTLNIWKTPNYAFLKIVILLFKIVKFNVIIINVTTFETIRQFLTYKSQIFLAYIISISVNQCCVSIIKCNSPEPGAEGLREVALHFYIY